MNLFDKYIITIPFLALLFAGNSCKLLSNNGAANQLSFASPFPDEVKPETSKVCFSGAYYRKLVSSKDKWLGIEGKVVLPKIIFDPDRRNPEKPAQYLDNPSIYMGGNMNGQETDVGLSWEVTKEENGKVSKERNAFRPFFRRSSYGDESAKWKTAPARPEFYWYPGEEVKMSVSLISEGMIKLTITGSGKEYVDSFINGCINWGLFCIFAA